MEKVPGQDGRANTPYTVDRGLAAPGVGMVDHVVVEQSGGVQVLKGNGQLVDIIGCPVAEPGRQQAEQGSDPFAAAEAGIINDLGEQGVVDHRQVIAHGPVDSGDLRLEQGQQFFSVHSFKSFVDKAGSERSCPRLVLVCTIYKDGPVCQRFFKGRLTA